MSEFLNNPAASEKLPLGLYLHIPFCRQKCLYCDFLSAPATDLVIAEYVTALKEQIRREAPAYRGYEVHTIFFGGGTPSLLSAARMKELMDLLREAFHVAADAEITMESNPGTLDADKLAGYRKAGINRLSMGLQSANDAELKALGRIHNYAAFLENFQAARKAGFDNINVDLMSALPGQTSAGWLDTLQKIAELGAEHISAYSLMIEEGTPFYERYGENSGDEADCAAGVCRNAGSESAADSCAGAVTDSCTAGQFPALPSEDEERLMYEQTARLLAGYGYHRYEISNYAKAGKECRHNVGYWKRTDYLGLGLGASSLVDNVRWNNTDELQEYLRIYQDVKCSEAADGEAADSQKADSRTADSQMTAAVRQLSPDCRKEVHALTVPEQMEEFMFLGLRLTDGISLAEFRHTFDKGLREVYGAVLDKLEAEELILFYDNGKRMRLTPRGVDVSNYVLAEFLLDS